MIIRGGHNIGSLEVEETFFRHPAVQEAAVIAVPHPKLGEDIQAFIVLRPGHTAEVEELRKFCLDKLADYKIRAASPLPTICPADRWARC